MVEDWHGGMIKASSRRLSEELPYSPFIVGFNSVYNDFQLMCLGTLVCRKCTMEVWFSVINGVIDCVSCQGTDGVL